MVLGVVNCHLSTELRQLVMSCSTRVASIFSDFVTESSSLESVLPRLCLILDRQFSDMLVPLSILCNAPPLWA